MEPFTPSTVLSPPAPVEEVKPPVAPPTPPKRRKRWVWVVAVVLVVLAAAAYYFWPRIKTLIPAQPVPSTGRGKGGGGATPVVAARAHKGNINDLLHGLGAVTPIYTVTVKSRVDGQIDDRHYKEGQMVQKGDPLMEIDPRPYQAALDQAEGNWFGTRRCSTTRTSIWSAIRSLVQQTGGSGADATPRRRRWCTVRGHGQDRSGGHGRRQSEPGVLPHHVADRRRGGTAAGGSRQHRSRDRHQRTGGDHADRSDQRDFHAGGGSASGGAAEDAAGREAAGGGVGPRQ